MACVNDWTLRTRRTNKQANGREGEEEKKSCVEIASKQNIYRISCEEWKRIDLRIERQRHFESQHSALIHIEYVEHLAVFCFTRVLLEILLS
jgi:hypothetical protein